MIGNISLKIVDRLVEKSIINSTQKELYTYGLFILLSQILYFTLTGILGVLFDIVLESVVFYIAFQFIRTSAGGIHASSELKCAVATSLALFVSVGIIRLCEIYNSKTVALLSIVAAASIMILCPMDTPEKPLNENAKKHFRKKSWIILLIIISSIGLGWYFKIHFIMYPCCVSLILESILLVLGKIKINKKEWIT